MSPIASAESVLAGSSTAIVWPAGESEMADLIRTLDWSSTPLRRVELWPHALRAVIDLILANGFPMVALWGPQLVQIYNDEYRALMGGKHPAGLGIPTRDCWPEVWSINQPIYDRVLLGETLIFEDALYPITRSGTLEDAWFTLSYSPLRDDLGSISGVLVTVVETTVRILAEKSVRASEARLRALVTATSLFVYRMNADWSALQELDGQDILADPAADTAADPTPNTASANAEWLNDYIHPVDQPRMLKAIGKAIENRTVLDVEHRTLRADGTLGWVHSRAVPLLDDKGDVAEWFGAASDITARKNR